MPCYHPLPGWYGRDRTATGKRPVVFNAAAAWTDLTLEIPCGHCIGCRLERSRQWALRCVHEAQLYDNNCFATLTYDNDHLPQGGSLQPEDFVLFMKRLRKAKGPGIRFFQCGEYGEQLQRPHHHALLFNCHFPDATRRAGSNSLFTSLQLDNLWSHGLTTIGQITFESAAYVARYALKKITGPPAEAHYAGRHPEYATMSRRPGIGLFWLNKYSADVYNHDAITLKGGRKARPPKYYDSKMPPDTIRPLKARRKYKQLEPNEDRTGQRLIVRETCKLAQLTSLQRTYEDQP